MKNTLIGLAIGLGVALIVYVFQLIKRNGLLKSTQSEIKGLKKMLNDRMDLEAEGIAKLKAENEELKTANENLRITNAALMQKPGKQEVQRLHIYQKAVDRLVINSPGFGAAWQSALKESEEEFAKIYNGTQAFWKKVLPGKTDAKLVTDEETIDDKA